MIHELPLERRTLHGHFSRELRPVLSVDPGDSVRFRALNAGWRWDADGACALVPSQPPKRYSLPSKVASA